MPARAFLLHGRPWRWAGGALLFGLLCAPEALSSTGFPERVRARLALSYTPECTICHDNNDGGDGTARTPLAISLQRFGLRGDGDLGALDGALGALEANDTDSDGDELADVEELRLGDDPNDGPGSGPPPPETGCAFGARRAQPWLALLALAVVAAVTRRSRMRCCASRDVPANDKRAARSPIASLQKSVALVRESEAEPTRLPARNQLIRQESSPGRDSPGSRPHPRRLGPLLDYAPVAPGCPFGDGGREQRCTGGPP